MCSTHIWKTLHARWIDQIPGTPPFIFLPLQGLNQWEKRLDLARTNTQAGASTVLQILNCLTPDSTVLSSRSDSFNTECSICLTHQTYQCHITMVMWHWTYILGWWVPKFHSSISPLENFAKVLVRFFESHSYLTGVATAKLRRHLSNMNTIFNR